MNYRERMLRQMWHNDLAKQNHQWAQERTILQNDLTTLQNSVDVAVVEGLNKEVATLKKQIQALTLLAGDRKQELDQEKQALINLAKQKLANKKQAKELLTQLETNWNNDRDTWEKEKAELEEQHQTELTNLTQQIQSQNQAYQDLSTQQQNSLKTIEELKAREQNLTSDLNQAQQNYNLAQEEPTHLKTQLAQSSQRETMANNIITELKKQVQNKESELTTLNQTLKQTQQKASRDQQTKQNQIAQFQKDKLNLQGQITNLNQQLTEQTQTISQQLAQLNEKDTKLAQQKQTQEQLKEGPFSQAQSAYRELRNQINKATIAWGRKEIEKKLKQLENFLDLNENTEEESSSEGEDYD